MHRKTQLTQHQRVTVNRLRQLAQAIYRNMLLFNELRTIHGIYQLFLIPL